ncbi:toll-like receptor 3 [Leptopilina heterotoma]|uniref:toll-like receptor 3 n=1 Tax=Leptopilina heterotoma TaxID=63436 RepID=UPI001CA83163|nr:toll-like receptor 3 [Leptopilina heterotoma]
MLVPFLFLGCILTTMGGYIPPGPKYRCPIEASHIWPCVCAKSTDEGLHIKCENSNLASLSLAFENLGNDGIPIEELVLYKCNIARLYGPALYTLNARILRLIDTPIKFIDEHSFLGVNQTLQELHIIGSKLEKFPNQAIQILGNLTILVIRGNRLESMNDESFHGSLAASKIERIEISNGTLHTITVESFAPLKKLKSLDLHGNNIKELKRNQFKGLKDMEYLDLSYNSIEKLEASHLSDLTKLKILNVSHNALGDLKRGTLARNSLLLLLNLSHNKIRKIDSNTFRGMRQMRRLYLSDNLINDVGRSTFESVTKVATIDLARNQIKKIDYQMFNQLKYAEVLDVAENMVTIVEKLSFKDLTSVHVNLSHNQISQIEPRAFENCANITVLDLSFNKINNFSKNSFDPNTYANELQLSFNFLTSLSQVPLQNMTFIKILNVSHNSLNSVPRNTFPKLYELHTIDLSYNNISEIHNGIFQTLFSLRLLNLAYNALEKIHPSTFGPLTTLLELDMSYNKLKEISRGSLTRLGSCRTLTVKHNSLSKIFQLPISLGHLDFSENSLEEIPSSDTWPIMNALLSLDLSKNRLTDKLGFGCFDNLLTLRTLNLAENNITKPPWEALSSLTSLQYLYLQDNNLTELSKAAFGRLPIVFELNLSNNQIKKINQRAFEGLLQLLTLNLSNNNLTHIANGAFQSLVSLRTLDLSFNNLEKLDNKTHGLLDDCLSLERVNLKHNKISFITRKMFPSNPWIPYKLKEIDLSYNTMPVLTFDITIGGKKLVYLNLSHNNINEIRRYVIGNLTSLETLDLSFNDINDISEPEIFKPPLNLTNLILNNNQFDHLPFEKIVAMPNLKLLDIEKNQFSSFNRNLMTIIKNDTQVRYIGNPLYCDCHVRPLKRWLNTFTEIPQEWEEMICSGPGFIENHFLSEITEDLMTCGEKDISEDSKLDITPDIEYRELEYNDEDDSWKATWYVTSREDIGDFYIVLREIGKKPLIEQDVVYSERSYKVHTLPKSMSKYELCILARDSIGNVKHFRDSQCQLLNQKFTSSGSSYLPLSAISLVFFTLLTV